MKIFESTAQREGDCNYCTNRNNKKVIAVEGNYIKTNFCEDCFNEMKKFVVS